MPFPDGSFDAVYDHALLHHLSATDRVSAVSEYGRVLKSGGLLVISALSTDEDAYEASPERPSGYFDEFFDSSELSELLSDFDVESVLDVNEADEASPRGRRRFVRAIARRRGEALLASGRRDPWGSQRKSYRERMRREAVHE